MFLTKEQFGGIVRLAVGVVAGWAIAQHWGDAAIWAEITTGAVVIGTAAWSAFTNRK